MNSEFDRNVRGVIAVLVVFGVLVTFVAHYSDFRIGGRTDFGLPFEEHGSVKCIERTEACFHSFDELDGKYAVGVLGASTYLLDSRTGAVLSEGYYSIEILDERHLLAHQGALMFILDAKTGKKLTYGYHSVELIDDTNFRYRLGSESGIKPFPEDVQYSDSGGGHLYRDRI